MRRLFEALDSTLATGVRRAKLRNYPLPADGEWHTILERTDLEPGHIPRFAAAGLTHSVDQTPLRFRHTVDDAPVPQLFGLAGAPAHWQSIGGISPTIFELHRFGIFPPHNSGYRIGGDMTGSFVATENLVQDSTGATCVYITGYNPIEVAYVSTDPAPNSTDIWVGQQTGSIFTPTTAPSLNVNIWGFYHRLPIPYTSSWKLEGLNAKSGDDVRVWVNMDYAPTPAPVASRMKRRDMRLFAHLRTSRISVYEEADLLDVQSESALVGGTFEFIGPINSDRAYLEGNIAIYIDNEATSDNRGTAIDDSLDAFWSDYNQGRNLTKSEGHGMLNVGLTDDGYFAAYKMWDKECFPYGAEALTVTCTNGDSTLTGTPSPVDARSVIFYYAPSSWVPTPPTPLPALNVFAIEGADRQILWDPSNDDIKGYNVYRGNVTTGAVTKINADLIPYSQATDQTIEDNYGLLKLAYTDSAQGSTANFYIVRAVNWAGVESADSNYGVVYWRPTDLGSQLYLWFDFHDTSKLYSDAALTTLAVNNGPVRGVRDKSGNAHNATYPSGTLPPRRSDFGLLAFGAQGTDGLTITALSGNTWTIFAAGVSIVNIATDSQAVTLGRSDSATASQLANLGRRITARASAGAATQAPPTGQQDSLSAKVFGFVLNGTTLTPYASSIAGDVLTTSASFTADRLFTRQGQASNLTAGMTWDGMVFCNAALSDQNWKLLDGFLRSSYLR